MRKYLPPLFAVLLAFLMVAIPSLYYRSYSIEWRNLRTVEAGVLYRSGQMTVPRLERVVQTHGIRTIVCLRGEKDSVDRDEEVWAKANKINFVRMAPLPWMPDATGTIPAEVNVKTFQNVMADPKNHPVLVHCFAGVHRTGIMCAIFRIDFQNWSTEDALGDMRANGYTILDDHADIQAYFKHRRPRSPRPTQVALPVSRQVSSHP